MYEKHGVTVKPKPSSMETIFLMMLSLSTIPRSLRQILVVRCR